MAEKKTDKKDYKKAPEKIEKKPYVQEENNEILVRIMDNDIPGSKGVYPGLTRIKGVSWSIAHATCVLLTIPPRKKIAELTKEDIVKIEQFLRNLPVANFLKNRRSDRETGETKHYIGSDLEIKKEFDIKRLKEIRSYKGIRHAAKLPVRGQRTRSHFRAKGRAMGIKKKRT